MSETNDDGLIAMESMTAERDAARRDLLAERVARYFDGSAFIRERLTIPADMTCASFGKHFSIEDGRAVARDALGLRIMSRERPGEAAGFDEALATLVSQSDFAEQITRRPRGDGTPSAAPPPMSWATYDKRPNAALPPVDRATYDKMSPWQQGQWARGGGRVI